MTQGTTEVPATATSAKISAKILDGIAVRDGIMARLKPRIAKLQRPPGLAVVLVGHDPASEVYVRNKVRACAELGFYSDKLTPPSTVTTEELLAIIDGLNQRDDIDGILVQMPLPKQVDSRRVLEAIAPEKDADGFHPMNVGNLVAGRPGPRACTPAGVMELLKHYNIPVSGKRAVILGRSDIVGKPQALMLLHESATVTICHSRTVNLAEECKRAEILVAAIGRAGFVTADFIAPGAIVIDVGINRVTDAAEAARFGKAEAFKKSGSVLIGDVHPVDALRVAGAFTPVPGGVGPLTIAMLMANTVTLSELRQGHS
ncbi:MAG: bifunctional methylenetetrahydrofolate dehydrogenase/methenyltetrahydrofolate cyclohydrolase FolD [Acidobacteriota bacterium]